MNVINEPTINYPILSEKVLLQELETAIKEKQLLFYYQPIVDLKNNSIVGFEALIRWQHPKFGMISPDSFIPLAEQHDLIRDIDQLLLSSVAEQIVKWEPLFDSNFYISVNISSQRFTDVMLVSDINRVIRKYNLPKNAIVVELTEHVLIKNFTTACHIFQQLKRMGVKISLDDFGTGYSSLSYLHQLPFDIIKIDRTFCSAINENNMQHPIIEVIISLAKTLNLKVVAEGIETAQQLEVLKAMNCDFGQGCYLFKPMNVIEIEKTIKSSKLSKLLIMS